MSKKKLNVVILLDDLIDDHGDYSPITKDLINRIINSDKLELAPIIVSKIKNADYEKINSGSFFRKLFSIIRRRGFINSSRKIFLALIHSFESKIFSVGSIDENSFDKIKLEFINIQANVSKSGLVVTYDDDELNKIKALKPDILLRGGSHILRGKILELAPYGIISLHNGDNDFYRGVPSVFYETYNAEPHTSYIVQILKKELDNGDVVLKGDINTERLWSKGSMLNHLKANISIVEVLEYISVYESLPPIMEKKPYSFPLFKMPKLHVSFFYVVNNSFHFLIKTPIKNIIKKLFLSKRIKNKVAFIINTEWRNISLWRSQIIDSKKFELTNPCSWKKHNQNFCFVDAYSNESKKKYIHLYELNSESSCLIDNVRLKYEDSKNPYIFSFNEEDYLTVSSNKNKSIDLYKCHEFPAKWKFSHSLIEGIVSKNHFIFHKENKYWLVVNILNDNNFYELRIFTTEDINEPSWKPQPFIDETFMDSKLYNAGFIDDDQNQSIFRVNVNNGFKVKSYLEISKINIVNNKYKEEKQRIKIYPEFLKNIKSLKSFSHSKGLTVFNFLNK